MPRREDREDFMTDYDPRWGNDNERDWDEDEPGADPGPDEDDE